MCSVLWETDSVADRSAEIQRLENMAKGMRSSYMAPNSPPQFPTKQALSVCPSTPSTNGADENRLGVRSPSTSKMITSLQKEMDALKGSSEAARAAAGRSLCPANSDK
jgi:hypothetical protein